MLRYFIFSSFLLAIVACQPNTYLVKSDASNAAINTKSPADESIDAMIAPYKGRVDEEMNRVIGEVATMLTKVQPECSLGNWEADLLFKKGKDYLEETIDFALLNHGGIRITSIPTGNLTKGKIFELMPFDNMVVAVEIKGSELPTLFNHVVAKGGWPISKEVKLTTQNGKAVDVQINGQKVQKDKLYRFVTNNYIANGGDNCSFLKDNKQLETGVLFRDAILEFVEEETKAGRKIQAKVDGRYFMIK